MAGIINWNDPQAWAIPLTEEQQRAIRNGVGSFTGGGYGVNRGNASQPGFIGYTAVTRQMAEQYRAQRGVYPNARIIEFNGSESKQGASPPSPSKTWGEFLTLSPNSALIREQNLWSQAQGRGNAVTPTLPQQLQERKYQTESVFNNPRQTQRESQTPAYSPQGGSSSPPATASEYAPRSEYSDGRGMPTYGQNFQSNMPGYGRDFQSNMPMLGEGGGPRAERGEQGGYGYLSQQQPATKLVTISDGIKMVVPDTGRSRGVDELRKELRDPGYQSRYDFKGVMAEKDAQQMVQEADKAAQEAAGNERNNQSGANQQSNTTGGAVPASNLYNQMWVSSRPIGGGHVAAQHVSGRWFLDYDLNNPWG